MTLHQSGTILCKSELPPCKLLTNPFSEGLGVSLKKGVWWGVIKAWTSSKQMLAQIQSGCCCSDSSQLLGGIFRLKLMLMGSSRSLVERHQQLASCFSLFSERPFSNSIPFVALWYEIESVSCQQNKQWYLFFFCWQQIFYKKTLCFRKPWTRLPSVAPAALHQWKLLKVPFYSLLNNNN